MTPEQFVYWLQGFAELQPTPPSPEQWQSIREHLATVFKKVTPPVQAPVLPPKPPLEQWDRMTIPTYPRIGDWPPAWSPSPLIC